MIFFFEKVFLHETCSIYVNVAFRGNYFAYLGSIQEFQKLYPEKLVSY